MAMLLMTLGDL